MVRFWKEALAKKAATNLRSKQKFCFEIGELRDIFFSERLEPNINIPQALGRAVLKTWRTTKDFFVWAEKRTRTELQKYAQSTRCKLFSPQKMSK